MIVYRLTTTMYKEDLSGNGAKLFGGRWNTAGLPVLYTTENISLAVLEILVRADKYTIPSTYQLLKITLPDRSLPSIIQHSQLKTNWEDDIGYTQWIGNEFLKMTESLVLKVPSAIVPEENNFLLNPKHADFKKVKITDTSGFQFDKRLFLDNE